MRLSEWQEKQAVYAIRIMKTRRNNEWRVRSFIRINFGFPCSVSYATRIWGRWRYVPCRSLITSH